MRPVRNISADRLEEARRAAAGVWCARLAEGQLTPDEQRAFDAWMDAAPDNRNRLDDAVRAWHAIEAVAASPELIVMRGEALESARRMQRRRWSRPSGVRARWIALAASLAILVLAGGAWLHYVPQGYATGTGERRLVSLGDGSRVSLDASTRVEVRYRGDRRELWLRRGRAKFEVIGDPRRPFSVAAGGKVIVATGTQFSVELLSTQVRVVLYEGRVRVLDAAGHAAPRPVRVAVRGPSTPAPQFVPAAEALTPGRELTAALDSGAAQVVQVDPGRTLSWEAGQLVFADEPLASAVERVNRYTADKIAVGDPAAARIPINGVFRAGDTGAFVEGVVAVSPLRIVRTEAGLTFVHR